MPAVNLISINLGGLPIPRHAHARARAFAREMTARLPDIINLQEIHTYALLATLRRHLSDLPHCSFGPGLVGPRAGLVTFSRQPITARRLYLFERPNWLRNHPKLTIFHRGILVSHLKDGLIVCDAHLSPNLSGDWSDGHKFEALQRSQLDAINRVTATLGGSIVLSGDFNLPRNSQPFEEFRTDGGWIDCFAGHTEPTFHTEFLPPGRRPHCIDAILVRGGWRADKAETLFQDKMRLDNGRESYISDHLGLECRLGIGGSTNT